MRLGVLFSGGKDSVYATYLEKQKGNNIVCLISIFSKNDASYMFHTPNIKRVKNQAKVMNIPLLIGRTNGEKEEELKDLEKVIAKAKKKYSLDGIITGALHSEYQRSRIDKICKELNLKCINPLWHKDEIDYLNELIKNNFEIMIIGIFAYPLDESWLGRKVDENFIEEVKKLKNKYKIHPAGEGGEFETFVINCPLFSKKLRIKFYRDIKESENSWRREIKL